MDLEEKVFPFEIKTLTEKGQFEGYAAVFGTPDAMGELVEPGAFTRTLKNNKEFPLLWYHDPKNPIGVVEVEQDAKGLKVRGQLNMDVQSAREKYSLMKQKAIKGLSFGFKTLKDAWNKSIRHLKEIKLYEVSPCTFQAHPKALVSSVKQVPATDTQSGGKNIIPESIGRLEQGENSRKRFTPLDGIKIPY